MAPHRAPSYIRRVYSKRKPSKRRPQEWDALGKTWKWAKASKAFRAAHPLCVACLEHGRTQASEVVDHIKPHKGDYVLFWDASNWQALCASCHNKKTRSE